MVQATNALLFRSLLFSRPFNMSASPSSDSAIPSMEEYVKSLSDKDLQDYYELMTTSSNRAGTTVWAKKSAKNVALACKNELGTRGILGPHSAH
ncbi:hypothetical protein HHL22_23355 [Hymenobacter sp. RP-2-7]|uniref:Uncharacterized protein n=1 Tax=Hymenobacter polaris TaxID=2682546 RepID=A0A7Y0AIU3_9BACT|nr:hypothetical protein [Hymenobacter polaris]NML68148.1 hypothetical protein [Hymenobacter polaris]